MTNCQEIPQPHPEAKVPTAQASSPSPCYPLASVRLSGVLKDLPTSNPPGLVLLPPPGREDVRDALCGSTLADLPHGARVGTSAARRIAQLLHVRPDLVFVPIRGNVPPRLQKLRTMKLDAVVLAAAGLKRLGLDDQIGELLPLDQFPPSPGQGALGIQIREDNEGAREIRPTA